VRENLTYGRPDAGEAEMIEAAREAQAHEFVMGLADSQGRTGYAAHVGERGVKLSGGQRQRIAIASAIAADPRLLIADEATSALDTIVQAGIVDLLDTIVRHQGMTLIFVTHDIALAGGFADRIAVLNGGRLMEAGPAGRVLGAPESAYTASLLASHIDLTTPPLVGVPQ
jgi:ABC-type multidrug transport system fused ATPase/permease subunit